MNPYSLEHDLPVTFAGYISEKNTYAYRLSLGEAKAMESCMFQMKVSQWLFDNLMPEDWTMGNDISGTKLLNESDKDVFVTFGDVHNAILFEEAFLITGITLEMLVP